MRSRRILVCGSDKGLGGGQAAFRRFVEFLDQEPAVRVGTLPIIGRSDKASSVDLERVTLRRLRSDSNPIQKGVALFRSMSEAKLFSPDLFISIGLSRSANAIMRSLPDNIQGIAYDFIGDRDPADRLLRKSLELFGHVCVQSPSMMTRLIDAGLPADRMSWAPCFPGPDYPEFARQGVSSLGQTLNLAFFGRLAHNKGLQIYIEALADLKDVPFRFDIWGSGPEDNNIVQKAHTFGLSSKVKLRGHYPAGEEGVRLMASYDAVVMPSQRLEGVPLVLIEAMAAGVTVLCTEIGAMKDVCRDNPDFFLSAPDVTSLTTTTQKLHSAIACGSINHSRLRRYYEAYYGYAAVAAVWRERLGLSMSLQKGTK